MTRSGGGPESGGGRDPKSDDSRSAASESKSREGRVPPGGRRLKKMARSAQSGSAGAYQGAFEATIAIVASAGIGLWADSHFGTEPRWLIVGLIVGFGALVLRLARMAKLLTPTVDDDTEANASAREEREGHGDRAQADPTARDEDEERDETGGNA